MITRRRRRLVAVRRLALVASFTTAAITAGATPRGAPQSAGSQLTALTLRPPEMLARGPDAIDSRALERWADNWFRSHLDDADTGAPGAVVAIVQGDQVLLRRGYGFGDLNSRTPVTPETVFRVGSISKPFTAAAIMQLVEADRVELRAPVNHYLRDMQVPVAFERAVTLLDLATHTAGFDVRLDGTAAPADDDVEELGTYLRSNLPPQVRRSGDVIAYSNQGYTLLGHVVEQVTGERFERYMAERLFAPLGMARSSFRLTPAAATMAATGYERAPSGGFRPSARIHPRVYPAAGLNTTADDVSRFMIALLNGGRVGAVRILSEASVAEMQRQQFTQSPGMPGIALGLFENLTRGERALVHGGGIRGFMSGLCLWPRYRLGLFVSNNGYSGALVQDFFEAFVRRFFPKRELAATSVKQTDSLPLEWFEGPYRATTATRATYEKAAALFGSDTEVRSVGGYLPHLDVRGAPFVRAGHLEFRLHRGDEPLAFVEGRDGRSARLVTVAPLLGCEVFEKVRWYQSARWHRELLALFCLSFLSVVLAPLSRFLRPAAARLVPGLRLPPPPVGRGGTWMQALLVVVAGLDLLFLALLAVALRLSHDTGVLYGIPPVARFDLALSVVVSLIALALPVGVYRAWRRGCWSVPARLHYTACAAAALAFIPFLRYWNLLGW